MKDGQPWTSRAFAKRADTAIVMPVFNGLRYTRRCVESLRTTDGDDFMVIVVDDGSTDGTADYLADNASDVHVITGTGDLWWSGGINLGCHWAIQHGAQRLILLSNDHAAISTNLVTDLTTTLGRTNGCVCSVSLAQRRNGEVRVLMAGGKVNWHRRGLSLTGENETYVQRDYESVCDWLPGLALAFNTDLFEELGGFDDHRLPQYKGDTDFTFRATKAGYPCVASYRSWTLNDLSQTGLNFETPVTLRAFCKGLIERGSNYQISSTLAFARKHCPRGWIPWYLTQFYGRYIYASLKSQRLRWENQAGRSEQTETLND